MGEEKAAGGFWTTIPGVLTGIAGLITAVAALVGALVAAGVVGPSAIQAPNSPPATASHAPERMRPPAIELDTSPPLNATKNQMNPTKNVIDRSDDLSPSKMK
jgi:hypothetical protein